MASSSPHLEDSTRALLDSVSRLDALQDPESDEDDNEAPEYSDDDSLSDHIGETPQNALEEAREKPSGRGLVIPQNYKTQLCRNWEKDKDCPYGKRCVFAHDLCELRTIQINLVAMAHVALMRQGKDMYGRPGIMAGPPDPSLYNLTAPDPNASPHFWYTQQYSEFMPGPPGFQQGFPPPAGELVWHEEKKKKKKEKKDKKHKKHKKHKKEKKDKESEVREKGEDGEKAEKKTKKHKKHKKHKKKDKKREEGDGRASSDSETDVPATVQP